MQYAIDLHTRQRVEATPYKIAACPQCDSRMIAKCGLININHWAHEKSPNGSCDMWMEEETEWHRDWKSHVPPDRREVKHNGHVVDMVLRDGTVVMLQRGALTAAQILQREAHYGTKDITWIFYGHDIKTAIDGVTEHTGDEQLLLRPKVNNLMTFRWKHPRKTYAFCDGQVFMDLGEFELARPKLKFSMREDEETETAKHIMLKLNRLHMETGPPYGGSGLWFEKSGVIAGLNR